MSLSTQDQQSIAKTRAKCESDRLSRQISSESQMASLLQRETGCTRTEALKAAYAAHKQQGVQL